MRGIFIAQIAILVIGVGVAVTLSSYPKISGTLIFTFLLGGLGGSMSLLRRLQSGRTFDGKWISTLMPILYGGVMALVAYFLFMSGIATGDGGRGLLTSNLFPNFKGAEIRTDNLLNVGDVLKIHPTTIQDVGKLLVWSFLAGYSERFLTSVLATLDRRAPSPAPR
jgi:hypothetical protein